MSQSLGEQQQGQRTTGYKVAIVILLAVIVGLVWVITQQNNQQTTSEVTPSVSVVPSEQPSVASSEPVPETSAAADEETREFLLNLPRRQEGDPLAKGDIDAPVVMTEWADYRCPYCSVFAEDTFPELQPLIDDGTLRVEFRDMAIFGEDSVRSAAAARAAGQQGLFWEFQAALFAELPNEGHPDVSDELVMQLAEQVGVGDLAAFEIAYQSEEVRNLVTADTEEAQSLGITSTPTFVIGTEVVSGAQPIEVFQQVIEEQAAELS